MSIAKPALLFLLLAAVPCSGVQDKPDYSSIPRIDVHAHVGTIENMSQYMAVRKALHEKYREDLALWINVQSPLGPRGEGLPWLKEAEEKFQGRFLSCLTNHNISRGLKFSPEEIAEWMERGVVGYKIWVGVSTAIDHPANDPTLTKMEQLGFPGASVHIAQPYPTRWVMDPVKFWQAQHAWKAVLDRHPRLIVVNAHMLDFFNSDEQLDYLGYMLETYPNLNVDLAARFQQFHRMSREKLRDFIIKYSDRILFGTDISNVKPDAVGDIVERYHRCFQLAETDSMVQGGFFGRTETRGLALPREVLEKIYWRNAARIYPRVKEVFTKLGYVTG
ncbi:MAG: amidohydrolase family protein [Acidobacteria bacterium]|nr:amidohydrolase family protein [Acidobacteriota bacterium]